MESGIAGVCGFKDVLQTEANPFDDLPKSVWAFYCLSAMLRKAMLTSAKRSEVENATSKKI